MRQRIWQLVQQNVTALKQSGSFTRNLAITLSGSTLSVVVGLVLTPVISRIYPPAAYGQFAFYNALVGNLNLLTTLAFPAAFMLPRSRFQFLSLVQLTLLVSVTACLVLAGVLIATGPWLRTSFHMEALGNWLYTVPLTLMVFNCNDILVSWYNRDKHFARRVRIDLGSTLISRSFTIGYGLLAGPSVVGMVLADLINRLIGTISLALGSVRHEFGQLLRHVSWRRIRAVAYKYRAFPVAYLPGGYVSMASAQLPVFLLAPVFGSTAVGLYSFSLSLLELPINVLGVAIGPVFSQKAAETYHKEPDRLPGITLNLYYKLLYLGLLPFSIVTVYGDVIFRILFGPKWEMAGVFTSYLGFYYVFKLLSVGTAGLYAILNKQRYYFYGNLLLLGLRALGLGIGAAYHDLHLTLLLFGMGSLMATFAVDLHVLSLLRLPIWRIALRTLALVGIALLAIKLSRWELTHYFPVLLR